MQGGCEDEATWSQSGCGSYACNINDNCHWTVCLSRESSAVAAHQSATVYWLCTASWSRQECTLKPDATTKSNEVIVTAPRRRRSRNGTQNLPLSCTTNNRIQVNLCQLTLRSHEGSSADRQRQVRRPPTVSRLSLLMPNRVYLTPSCGIQSQVAASQGLKRLKQCWHISSICCGQPLCHPGVGVKPRYYADHAGRPVCVLDMAALLHCSAHT